MKRTYPIFSTAQSEAVIQKGDGFQYPSAAYSSTIHFSIFRVRSLKFTPILNNLRASLWKGRA